MTYCQCVLTQKTEKGERVLVEWVQKHLSTLTGKVNVNGEIWHVQSVHQEEERPRSSHKNKL